MLTAVQVVWWLGLGGALLLTAVLLKQVLLLLQTLRGIEELARHTQEAALNIAENVQAVSRLALLAQPVQGLGEAARRAAAASATLDSQLTALDQALQRRR